MNTNKIYVGVDFGGTKILTGAMNAKGEILSEPVKIATNSAETPDIIVKGITDSIECILQSIHTKITNITSIGLGVTGPLDIKNGVILQCPQLPTMHYFPLRKKIEEHFSVPVYMNNDANCLIYAEVLFGSGTGKKNVVGFTLGTGLGCAVILNHKIFIGSNETAGEVWISPYNDGIIEDFVSGTGISKIYKQISGDDKTPLEIEYLADQKNINALITWDEFGRHLASAIAWAINIIDPEIVILGGSITNAFKFFSPSLEKHLRKKICPVPSEKTKIVCAKLGSNAGFIGAASLGL